MMRYKLSKGAPLSMQRPAGPADKVAALRETVSRQDEAIREAGAERARLQEEMCRLRRWCEQLDARLSIRAEALEKVFAAGGDSLRRDLGIIPRRRPPRRNGSHLTVVPGHVPGAVPVPGITPAVPPQAHPAAGEDAG